MTVARLHPDPHLRIHCTPVDDFGARIGVMAANLARAMYDSEGRGFAAPQYNDEPYDLRLFVMDAGWKASGTRTPRVCINPRITAAAPTTAIQTESCLSIPDTPRQIARPEWVDVEWFDIDGTLTTARLDGVEAAIFQHELDHLNGVLILDHPEAPSCKK